MPPFMPGVLETPFAPFGTAAGAIVCSCFDRGEGDVNCMRSYAVSVRGRSFESCSLSRVALQASEG